MKQLLALVLATSIYAQTPEVPRELQSLPQIPPPSGGQYLAIYPLPEKPIEKKRYRRNTKKHRSTTRK